MKIGDMVVVNKNYKGLSSYIGMIGKIVAVFSSTVSVHIKTATGATYLPIGKNSLDPCNPEIFPTTLRSADFTPQRIEKPCSTCKRNNDLGVKTCWCCGNKP